MNYFYRESIDKQFGINAEVTTEKSYLYKKGKIMK